MMMDNNLLTGGLLGALVLKQAYDESIKRDNEHHIELLRAIAEANKPEPTPVVVEPYEAPKRVWPFV
jgi:hypothetical protein